MATTTVVCPECGAGAVPGRFACPECGALVAAVGVAPRRRRSPRPASGNGVAKGSELPIDSVLPLMALTDEPVEAVAEPAAPSVEATVPPAGAGAVVDLPVEVEPVPRLDESVLPDAAAPIESAAADDLGDDFDDDDPDLIDESAPIAAAVRAVAPAALATPPRPAAPSPAVSSPTAPAPTAPAPTAPAPTAPAPTAPAPTAPAPTAPAPTAPAPTAPAQAPPAATPVAPASPSPAAVATARPAIAPTWPPEGSERPLARPAPRTPAGAYLSPSPDVVPTEGAPAVPRAAPGAPAVTAAATSAAQPAPTGTPRVSLAETLGAFGITEDVPRRLIGAGATIAGLGFLLPWASALAGNALGGSYFSRWGLGGPGHWIIVLGLVALVVIALAGSRFDRVPVGLIAVVLSAVLVGVLWPYVFGTFDRFVGVWLVLAGAILLGVGGLLDVRRHEPLEPGV